MALTWGSRAKRPCPVCLAPLEELSDISRTWQARTVEHTQQIIKKAKALKKTAGEKLLSEFGIRNVEVSLF